jgi:hypothetical protein
VSSLTEIEQLQAEAEYHRHRAALPRANLHRSGLGSSARLHAIDEWLSAHNRACAKRGGVRSREATC